MVIAYHAIWAARGFWLPNDPRGSWSTEVWAKHLRPFGEATKTNARRSLAHDDHDRQLRREAKRHLLYPSVRFHGVQARAIARGIASVLPAIDLHLFACAIMPDHVHIVVARHPSLWIEQIVGFLKRSGTRQLNREGIHPLARYRDPRGEAPSPWVKRGWYRFIDSRAQMMEAIDYVRNNPRKIGLRAQRWWFVEEYRG
jgi:REP element-mobilizing transposase RayT